MGFGQVAKLILVVVVIFFAGSMIKSKVIDTSSVVLDPIKVKNQLDGCKESEIMVNDLPDCDGDGYPDTCDPCIDGDSTKDKDGDGMADACETEETRDDPDKVSCRHRLEGRENQCGVGENGMDGSCGDYVLEGSACADGSNSNTFKFIAGDCDG
ncbi:MAG: hypothetical protein R6V53_03330 [Candidatus Woesearchaeota archaeon]